MSKDQYLEMCEQTNQDVDWEKCPPAWEDFPDIVITALNVYNTLGSKVYPDLGFVGKDFTNFDFILNKYGVEEHNVDYVFDIVTMLESRDIEISQKRLKAEYEKIKRK
jgi:hypothetical protein